MVMEEYDVYYSNNKKTKAYNRDRAQVILKECGIYFTIYNDGSHLLVEGWDELIDFWPGTGKWIARNCNIQGTDINELLSLFVSSSNT